MNNVHIKCRNNGAVIKSTFDRNGFCSRNIACRNAVGFKLCGIHGCFVSVQILNILFGFCRGGNFVILAELGLIKAGCFLLNNGFAVCAESFFRAGNGVAEGGYIRFKSGEHNFIAHIIVAENRLACFNKLCKVIFVNAVIIVPAVCFYKLNIVGIHFIRKLTGKCAVVV